MFRLWVPFKVWNLEIMECAIETQSWLEIKDIQNFCYWLPKLYDIAYDRMPLFLNLVLRRKIYYENYICNV